MKKFIHFGSISDQQKTGLNLVILQAVFFLGWAFTSYSNVYLQELGFSASSIGLMIAVNNIVAIFANIFWGMLSDKINSIKKTLIIVFICMAIFYTSTPLLPSQASYSVVMFFVYYSFVNIFKGSVTALLDNMTIRTCSLTRVNYGIVRSTGSLFFMIASFISVSIANSFGVRATFFTYGAIGIFIVISAFFAYDPQTVTTQNKEKLDFKPLFKNYFYVCFLIFSFIFYTAINAEVSFLTYFMEDIGIDPKEIGTFLAVRATFEIPLLICIIKLRSKFKLKNMLSLGIMFMVLQCICLGFFAKDLLSMSICGAIFGTGNGLVLGSVPAYLYKLAPERLKASAQSVFASVCAVSGIIGSFLGGIAFEPLGARLFYIVVGVAMLISVLIFKGSFILKKNQLNPADELN